MLYFINKLLNRKKTTAQIILKELFKKGIHQEDIRCEHIMHVYRSMNNLPWGPDFSSIKDIFPDRITSSNMNKPFPIYGIVVETRKHPALELVVNNFIKNINIPIQIFHGRNNLEFIMSTTIAKEVDKGNIHLNQLEADKLCAKKYNALFLSKRFWENVLCRNKILVFQTDAISCSNSSYTINDFISYDYIGSKWDRQRPVGLITDGGNGGLSIRDWSMTYDCLNRFSTEHWTGGEDVYFAFHFELMGGKVGKANDCAKFSTQHEFLFNSWGAHQISCLNNRDKAAFLRYCEEAKFMKY